MTEKEWKETDVLLEEITREQQLKKAFYRGYVCRRNTECGAPEGWRKYLKQLEENENE